MFQDLSHFLVGNKITIPTNKIVVWTGQNLLSQLGKNSLEIDLEEGSSLEIFEINKLEEGFDSFEEIINVFQAKNTNLKWFKLIKTSLQTNLTIYLNHPQTTTQVYNLLIPELDSKIVLDQKITANSDKNTIEHSTKSLLKHNCQLEIIHSLKATEFTQNLFANQQIKVLPLAQKIKTKIEPILDILSDSVKCNHGASFGGLDQSQLDFMEARGLSKSQSIEILSHAFVRDILKNIEILCVYEDFLKIAQ
jgi:Fe-S cluster assembly protein SufD